MNNTFQLEHLTQTQGTIVTNESKLSICLSYNGFTFAVVDKNYYLQSIGEFSVDLTGSIPQVMLNIKTCFSSIGIHIFNFNNIRVVCPTNKSIWMPVKLYDSSKNKEYLSIANTIYSNETIISNISQKLDAVNVFACNLHLYSGVKIVMSKANYVSPFSVIAEYAYDISSLMQNTFVLYKRKTGIDYAIFQGNTFLLSNSFDYKDANDMIYFVLSTLKQLKINTAEVDTIITGEKFNNEEQTLLKRYIKHVSYANCAENVTIPAEFESLDLQKYFLLLA